MTKDTKLLPTDTPQRREASLAKAAEILSSGGLVAFPTETVYGLGADATSSTAVAAIFEAKGRPANNPLIVHVSGTEEARRCCTEWPDAAEKLAAAFWPGPLTMILPADPRLAINALGGGATVGLRAPRHPLALDLLRQCGLPLAAPSANLSSTLSPTTAEAVMDSLSGRIDAVLDGGLCEVGIESTVVDLSSGVPVVLRPGMIEASRVASTLGVEVTVQATSDHQVLKSPGMLTRHYAPSIPLRVVEALSGGEGVFAISLGNEASLSPRAASLPRVPDDYAAGLYQLLRIASQSGAASIEIEALPDTPEWEAINDRLKRASASEDA